MCKRVRRCFLTCGGIAAFMILHVPRARAQPGGAIFPGASQARVVVADSPSWQAGKEWRIDPKPTVSIGLESGPDAYLLLNPTAAVVLSDGGIVIGESARSLVELRYYDSSGRFVRSAGRVGDGPGEFRGIAMLFVLPGDSLLVYEWGRGKLTWFDPAGKFIRATSTSVANAARAQVMAMLAPDRLVVMQELNVPTSEGFSDDRRRIAILDLESSRLINLGTVSLFGSYNKANERGTFNYEEPFGSTSYAAAHNGRLWVGNSESYAIHAFNATGMVDLIIRSTRALTPVTAVDQRLFKNHDLTFPRGQSEETLIAKRALHSQIPFPRTMPAYQDLIADRTGNLWVLQYRPPFGPETQRWNVHGASGELLGVVQIPNTALSRCAFVWVTRPCKTILDIGENYVLFVTRDAYDVRRVVMHRLIKP